MRSGPLNSEGRDRVDAQRHFAACAMESLAGYLAARRKVAAPAKLPRVERLGTGQYRVGDALFDTFSNIAGALTAVKKSIPVSAVQMDEMFEVVTSEGIMRGQPHDWLMCGVMGEVYICPDAVFRRSYDISDPAAP